jgi:lysophospholipase L1-like esterase
MNTESLKKWALAILVAVVGVARAEPPATLGDNTQYLAMGDSLAAGKGALPTTQGYAYLLYQKGTFDSITNTTFANIGIPGATSADVLAYQVPQAVSGIFAPHVITLSVGGNDLIAILGGADPTAVLGQFQANLGQVLCGLRATYPQARIYTHNLYDIPQITANVPGGLQVIQTFNAIMAGVAQACHVSVADVYSAFSGRTGLLLIERNRAGQFEVHPTDAGHRVIAQAFEAVHR